MATITTTATQQDTPVLRLNATRAAQAANASEAGTSGADETPAWLTQLRTEGWCVVPGAVPADRAAKCVDAMYSWVEAFGLGFDRNDPSTRLKDNLHYFYKGGLSNAYGIAHEQFMWDIKQEPGVVEAFEKIWGTNELIVSFDGANIGLSLLDRPPTDPSYAPWAHVDQSPLDSGLHAVQGIVNLLPNGPDDGGLMLLRGSMALYAELFEAFEHQKPENGWNKRDRHDHTPEQLKWLEDRGCTWHKVCAGPGDLLLWDSRVVHYGATPKSNIDRLAVYACYKPAVQMGPEAAERRRHAWEHKLNSTHDPVTFMTLPRKVPSTHPTHKESCERPLQQPVLTPRGRQLVGLDAY